MIINLMIDCNLFNIVTNEKVNKICVSKVGSLKNKFLKFLLSDSRMSFVLFLWMVSVYTDVYFMGKRKCILQQINNS